AGGPPARPPPPPKPLFLYARSADARSAAGDLRVATGVATWIDEPGRNPGPQSGLVDSISRRKRTTSDAAHSNLRGTLNGERCNPPRSRDSWVLSAGQLADPPRWSQRRDARRGPADPAGTRLPDPDARGVGVRLLRNRQPDGQRHLPRPR